MTFIYKNILFQINGLLFVLLSLGLIHASANSITTDKADNSSTSLQISFEHTTANDSLYKKTGTTLNLNNKTMNIINRNTSTITSETIQSKGDINGKANDYDTKSTSNSDGLSGGAIAGIVIGVIFLVCCCGCGGTYASGHWEDAKVWVEH